MKKLLLALALVAVVAVICVILIGIGGGGGSSDAKCEVNWAAMDVSPGDEEAVKALILYLDQEPGSVGYILKQCFENGWTGYR